MTKKKKKTDKEIIAAYADEEMGCPLYPDECDGQTTSCERQYCPWGSEYN